MEVDKWKIHFKRMADGKLRPNPRGKYVIGANQSGGTSKEPTVKFVTPMAQAVELAKSEMKEETYMGKPIVQIKRVNKRTSTPKKRKSTITSKKTNKKPRVEDLVWGDRKR